MTNEPTRERLERALGVLKLHHKMLVNEIDGMTHDINESIDAFAVGIALANAELERQSVTDEDVANAIEHLEYWQESVKEDDGEDVLEDIYEKSVKNFHAACRLAIQALQAYRTVTVTWENTDDCPMAICSGCGATLASYSWYDALVAGPENYCQYCGGKIVEEVRE